MSRINPFFHDLRLLYRCNAHHPDIVDSNKRHRANLKHGIRKIRTLVTV
jgi:hypothetical protein